MARVFYVLAIVLLSVSFSGLLFASEKEEGVALQASKVEAQAITAAAVRDSSFITDVFTSTVPAQGCSSTADRVFSSAEQISLTVRFFNAVLGDVQRIRVVTNGGGQVVIPPIVTTTAASTPGAKVACETIGPLAPGTYFYSAILVTPTGIIMSPNAFPFVVE